MRLELNLNLSSKSVTPINDELIVLLSIHVALGLAFALRRIN